MHSDTPIRVSDLNRLARQCLEKTLPICWVTGEISNLTLATSGHWYFTLKDSNASVRCVMFRNRNQFVDWPVNDGEHVEIRAQASLYEARGDFQLTVDAMRHAGQGNLFEAFLRLKTKLEKEGLFASEFKRPVPTLPKTVGLITSTQGAAIQDVLITLKRRWPLLEVIIYPTIVQGPQAPEQIVSALKMAGNHAQCDILLLVRGGGSLEDLQCFNDENVARAISECHIPVITGIGHETDFTIADFVADCRAPTPTAAAETASPDKEERLRYLLHLSDQLASQTLRRWNAISQGIDRLSRALRRPSDYIKLLLTQHAHLLYKLRSIHAEDQRANAMAWRETNQRLSLCEPRTDTLHTALQQTLSSLRTALQSNLTVHQSHYEKSTDKLNVLNPRLVLARGYALVSDLSGKMVSDPKQLHHHQPIQVELANGVIFAEVLLH